MRQRSSVAHHEQTDLPRGTVVVGLAVLSWMAVISLWQVLSVGA